MSTSSSRNRISKLLLKHKHELGNVDLDPILIHLVKKRVISSEEENLVRSASNKVEKLIEILPGKGLNAFREFCVVLEQDCPHLLNSLLAEANGKSIN